MQTLAIEGAKNDIRVNCLAPTAATRVTENLRPEAVLELLRPRALSAREGETIPEAGNAQGPLEIAKVMRTLD